MAVCGVVKESGHTHADIGVSHRIAVSVVMRNGASESVEKIE